MGRTPFTDLEGFFSGPGLLAFIEHVGGLLSLYDEGIDVEAPVRSAMTQINVHFVGNSREDHLLGEARWVRKGRTQSVIEVRVTDSSGRLIAQSTCTHAPVGLRSSSR
ncbi:MAG: PaaI family thioesterase [Dehalococcoidia bacterium]